MQCWRGRTIDLVRRQLCIQMPSVFKGDSGTRLLMWASPYIWWQKVVSSPCEVATEGPVMTRLSVCITDNVQREMLGPILSSVQLPLRITATKLSDFDSDLGCTTSRARKLPFHLFIFVRALSIHSFCTRSLFLAVVLQPLS